MFMYGYLLVCLIGLSFVKKCLVKKRMSLSRQDLEAEGIRLVSSVLETSFQVSNIMKLQLVGNKRLKIIAMPG